MTCASPTSTPPRRPPQFETPASEPSHKAEEALGRVRNGLRRPLLQDQRPSRRQESPRSSPTTLAGLISVQTGESDTGKPTITWSRNQDAIDAAGALDGLYALATNLADPQGRRLSALDVLKIYKDQWIDEQRHRDLKQTLRVRPVFLHNDVRIEALIAVIGVALLIFGLIEAELRAALGDADTPARHPARRPCRQTHRPRRPRRLRATSASPTPQPASSSTHSAHIQRIILALLGVGLPWPESRQPTQQ